MKNKQYWMCMIGPADPSEYKGNGADGPLRNAVRNTFYDMFEPDDDVCSSGWGINEERYDLLRIIHLYSTEELKKVLFELRTRGTLS